MLSINQLSVTVVLKLHQKTENIKTQIETISLIIDPSDIQTVRAFLLSYGPVFTWTFILTCDPEVVADQAFLRSEVGVTPLSTTVRRMSRLHSLKLFVSQRLTAAVDEIFGHFERTISEYEEELERRHRKLLDAVLTPEKKPRTAGWCSLCCREHFTANVAKLTSAKPSEHSMLASTNSR